MLRPAEAFFFLDPARQSFTLPTPNLVDAVRKTKSKLLKQLSIIIFNKYKIWLFLSKEDYEAVIPEKSAIFVDDYPDLSKLVDYVKYLDKNDTAYMEYFSWRYYYGKNKYIIISVNMMNKIFYDIEIWTICYYLPSYLNSL